LAFRSCSPENNTDMATAFAQSAALFAFATWLDKPSTRTCVWMGITLGLAVLAKFTTLLYLPAAAAAIVVCKWLFERKRATPGENRSYSTRQVAAALLIAIVVIWGGYRFAIGHVQESMQVSPQTMPSFQHLPATLRPLARKLVLSDPALPAPGLLRGIVSAYMFTKEGASSYFLGTTRIGGWWYFFFVDLAVKSPLPFLILGVTGFIARFGREKKWTPLAPGVSALAILLATTTVKVYYGIRHVIVLFPLLAIVARCGAAWLWQQPGNRRIWGRLLLFGLLLWQCISTVAAHHDYIAYFNELAGHDPSRIFVAGCDLDCGQELFRLSQAARARHISQITIAIWSSADLTSDLPTVVTPQPFVPTPGWFAISLRARRIGDFLHTSYPPGAFAWLDQYQPVERVGKTRLLYYIPENGGSKPAQNH
jgi:4-amino-4-deoxy-L-arabinose transferase-like glycosyltransferase